MTSRPWGVWLLLASACASPNQQVREADLETVRHVDKVEGPSSTASLAGVRCRAQQSGACRCRASAVEEESDPPAEGKKRFEIRLSADGGRAEVASPTLGRFETTGAQEVCFYVDVDAGSSHSFAFTSQADKPDRGVTPVMRIVEYGPVGPHWYEIFDVRCAGGEGRCDRQGADDWVAQTVTTRKRGRLDPCGSAVISKLAWDTSGGMADRDGGHYRDFTVRFDLEVKKFATQFAPGSTECVPK